MSTGRSLERDWVPKRRQAPHGVAVLALTEATEALIL